MFSVVFRRYFTHVLRRRTVVWEGGRSQWVSAEGDAVLVIMELGGGWVGAFH